MALVDFALRERGYNPVWQKAMDIEDRIVPSS
jgi:hypothetical protein